MAVASYSKTGPLGNGLSDFLRTEVLFFEETKRPLTFVAVQLYAKGDRIYEIKKHDFSHGVYNVHRNYLGKTSREEHRGVELSNSLILECRNDIRENWRKYRDEFVLRHGGNI